MGRGDKGASDEELRAKLEETQRRLESTSRELVAALGKLHGSGLAAPCDRGTGSTEAEIMGMCPCGHIGATCMEHGDELLAFLRARVHGEGGRGGVHARVGADMREKSEDVLKLEKLIGEITRTTERMR